MGDQESRRNLIDQITEEFRGASMSSTLEGVMKEEWNSIIVIGTNLNGDIIPLYNYESNVEAIGLLEVMKELILRQTKYVPNSSDEEED